MRHNILILIGAATMALPACSSSAGAESSDYQSASDSQAEYRAEAAKLTLPQGVAFPQTAPGLADKSDDGQTVLYQKDIGAQKADALWYCSWAKQALNATGPEQTKAVETMKGLRDLVFWSDIDDNGVALFTALQEKAQLGDLSGLREYVDTKCP